LKKGALGQATGTSRLWRALERRETQILAIPKRPRSDQISSVQKTPALNGLAADAARKPGPHES
jgi:hypothetical protein